MDSPSPWGSRCFRCWPDGVCSDLSCAFAIASGGSPQAVQRRAFPPFTACSCWFVVPQPSGDSGPCVGPVPLDPQFVRILARLHASICRRPYGGHPVTTPQHIHFPKLTSFLVCISFLCVVRKLFFQGLVNGQKVSVTVTRATCIRHFTTPATRSLSL